MSGELHGCALAECDQKVARKPGEGRAHYLRRHFCTPAHRDIAKGRTRTARAAPWRTATRVCAADDCDVAFIPHRESNIYHDRTCSARSRARGVRRETKVCECPCGATFERPAKVDKASWGKRRFATPGCYNVWRTGRPSEARTGKRREPRVQVKKKREPKVAPKPKVVEPPPVFWRPPAPVVVRPERTTRRPSFGLSRNSA